MTDAVKKTLEYLKKSFEKSECLSSNPNERYYRLEHTLRVREIGRKIALNEGFDVEAMEIACLLHDISYINGFESSDDWKNHGRNSAKIAEPFVRSLGFDDKKVNDILFSIAVHVDDKSDFEGERTRQNESVIDADNIDRFDVYRIHETLMTTGFIEKNLESRLKFTEDKIEDLKRLEKIRMNSETADKMWQDRISFSIEFYERLRSQLKNSAE